MSAGELECDLDGRTALVTGASRGIGRAVAGRFARAGARTVVSDCRQKAGEETVSQLVDAGHEATFVECDVREDGDLERLMERTADLYGGIDVLVNNAAVQSDNTLENAEIDDWNRIVETDFRAYWLAVKHALPHLGMDSSVINVSSNHAVHTIPAHFPYNAVKAGIEGMTRAMAVELGARGVRVNAIRPGWVAVDRVTDQLTDDQLEHLRRIHPAGRIGRPEDVAATALWLASEGAGFVTGSVVTVDGGRAAVMQDDAMTAQMDG